MSWQPYIDDQLLAKGFMHAAIVSHGGSLWAASEDFFIHPSEVGVLVAALVPPSDDAAMKQLATRGFTLNETGRYALTRADVSDEELVPMLIGRCKTVGEPSTGVVVCATHSALVVGIYDGAYSEGASFGGVTTEMHQLASFIMEQGFLVCSACSVFISVASHARGGKRSFVCHCESGAGMAPATPH
eukprot:TRINITY_DN1626_c0_g1_i11.p2 TRINITY_DN1626_c0_g1~~TRINITY_DN1626_c0_g1_i11.p2  ORF type:complete len:187 (+),score=49.08 TRINITY_DN1626_c0_g1_i11:443-1003(+)